MPIHVYDTHIKNTHELKDTIAHSSPGKVPFRWCHTGECKDLKSMSQSLKQRKPLQIFNSINIYTEKWQMSLLGSFYFNLWAVLRQHI